MRKPLPLTVTRTPELPRGELTLAPPDAPPPAVIPERRPADRIKEALLRWLEEEL
jgi:hypothetical protein